MNPLRTYANRSRTSYLHTYVLYNYELQTFSCDNLQLSPFSLSLSPFLSLFFPSLQYTCKPYISSTCANREYIHVDQERRTVNPVIYAAKKIMRFCRLTKNLFLLNNIYANQIPGQSTCVKSFIFASSYLCALNNYVLA